MPPIFEQTRIAEIFIDMDSEIESLERKLEKYELIKQGMMQELLTGKTRLV
jgi:type I restriction enzyme S subunit